MKKEKEYIEKIIGNKKVRLKIINQSHGAWAGLDGRTININEKTKNKLSPRELGSVLFHERGHFTFVNQLLTWLPTIIIFGFIFYFFINYLNQIITFLFLGMPVVYTICFLLMGGLIVFILGILIELPIYWAKEILADRYAVRRTKKDIFRKTLERIYKYNKNLTKPSLKRFYKGFILHPPQPIRLKIIKYLEERRK